MAELAQDGTNYVDILQSIIAITEDLMGFILQELPETQFLYAGSNVIEENYNLKRQLDDAFERIHSLERRLRLFRSNIDLHDTTASAAVIEVYSDLEMLQQDEDCHSLLKKNLTEQIIDNLIEVRTKTFNSTLMDCVQSGFRMHSSTIGLIAADSECFDDFALLFDPIIRDCHSGLSIDFAQPPLDWGNPSALNCSDAMQLYIEKCGIFCSRSLKMQPFFPIMKEKNYVNVMEIIRPVIDNLFSQIFPGSFHALEAIDEDTKARLKGEGFMFDEGDETAQATGSSNHWPTGRAVYISQDKSFVVYINHKNHIRFGCVRNDGDFAKLYEQMVICGKSFDEYLPCARHPKYGWLTASPALLGTSLEIIARVRLAKLPQNIQKFNEILSKSNLKLVDQVSMSKHIFCEVRNTNCLGFSEFDTMAAFVAGINDIISAEIEM